MQIQASGGHLKWLSYKVYTRNGSRFNKFNYCFDVINHLLLGTYFRLSESQHITSSLNSKQKKSSKNKICSFTVSQIKKQIKGLHPTTVQANKTRKHAYGKENTSDIGLNNKK